jgi:hypothetical protein
MSAMARTILIVIALSLGLPAMARAQESCPALLLALDDKGRVTRGSKKALLDAAGRGDSLRVGWSLKWGKRPHDGVQHWHDAPFVTVFEGEVFTQVPMIHRQDPKPGKRHIALSPAVQHWSALLGTNGMLVGRFSDGGAPQELRVAQTWCLDGAAAIACSVPRWRLVYRHGADGRPRAGSKAALIAAIRRGDPVRVAWATRAHGGQARTLEQSADAIAVSIAGGSEVRAELVGRAALSTDGSLEAIAPERASGEQAPRRAPQRVAVAWFAQAPDPSCDSRTSLDLVRAE